MLPAKSGSSAEGPTLTLPDLSFDDEGIYECEAYNSQGSDTYQGRINVQGNETLDTDFTGEHLTDAAEAFQSALIPSCGLFSKHDGLTLL